MTRSTVPAMVIPMVPVPQHKSSNVVFLFLSMLHHSAHLVYSNSVAGVLTWKNALLDKRNLLYTKLVRFSVNKITSYLSYITTLPSNQIHLKTPPTRLTDSLESLHKHIHHLLMFLYDLFR